MKSITSNSTVLRSRNFLNFSHLCHPLRDLLRRFWPYHVPPQSLATACESDYHGNREAEFKFSCIHCEPVQATYRSFAEMLSKEVILYTDVCSGGVHSHALPIF